MLKYVAVLDKDSKSRCATALRNKFQQVLRRSHQGFSMMNKHISFYEIKNLFDKIISVNGFIKKSYIQRYKT